MAKIKYSELREEASKYGLRLVSCLEREKIESRLKREVPHLNAWQDAGYPGEMSYMKRSEDLLCDPSNLLAQYKSILTFLVPYSSGGIEPLKSCPPGYGKVARYAQGFDYHEVLRGKLSAFIKGLNLGEGIQFRIFSDSVPTLERAISNEGGLGFIGKSSMLISPELGTYTFICELIWDLEVCDIPPPTKIKSRCGTCNQCKVDCPTNAIVSDYKIDARKCISYLTIENRGEFSREEGIGLGDWVFGCDVCQDVCPHNFGKKDLQMIPTEFKPESGVGPLLSLKSILEIKDDKEFKEKFIGTALLRTKRKGLVRNAIAVILNQGARELLPQIESLVRFDNDLSIRRIAFEAEKFLLDRVE